MEWIRHYADVIPSKGIILIRQQIYQSNNSKGLFKKKRLVTTTVETKQIVTPIPFEEIEVDVEHFDSKAFQSDDRFFTTKQKIKIYNHELMKAEASAALIGYNTEPKLYHPLK